MVNQKELNEIIKKIGHPDSKKIETLIERIKSLDEHDRHCGTVALYLMGCDEQFPYDSNPLFELWVLGLDMVFLKNTQSIEYLAVPAVKERSEINEKKGFYIDEDDPGIVEVSLTDGNAYELSLLYKQRKEILENQDTIVDLLSQLGSDSVKWECLSHMVRKFKVVAEVSVVLNKDNGGLIIDHYHQCTHFYNQGQFFCIDKFERLGRDVTLTDITPHNYKEFFQIYPNSAHFFITNKVTK